MRWLMPKLRDSLFGLLGHSVPPSESTLDNALEDIREAMLDLLGEDGARDHPQITRRIRYATELQALWYLRGDLLAVLAGTLGEATARARLQSITAMFRGVLPGSLNSRSSPLVG